MFHYIDWFALTVFCLFKRTYMQTTRLWNTVMFVKILSFK